jgi:hypothetical protein
MNLKPWAADDILVNLGSLFLTGIYVAIAWGCIMRFFLLNYDQPATNGDPEIDEKRAFTI